MGLTTGTKLGPYEIQGKLGAGGMGEVYRARDTKLGRDVALKVLPEQFAQHRTRVARFQREARLLASLNHPNIAAIYGLEESAALLALVMELVEGKSLGDLIAGKPMPIGEALPIARQIAEGLEYAHEKGIIHRDLKPANTQLSKEHQVKILDFGLAKALDDEGSQAHTSDSPTLPAEATQAGMILGTPTYMSPEQAQGKAVDRRADIWAFGCVLYEMLTGKRAVEGETLSDTLAAVLRQEPDWSALPEQLPAPVGRLLRRCLTKDPRQRLRDIGEARIAIEEAMSGSVAAASDLPAQAGRRGTGTPWRAPTDADLKVGATDGTTAVDRRSTLQRALPWASAAAASVLAIVTAILTVGLWRATRPVEQPLTRLSVDLGPEAVTGLDLTAAISPDGRRLVFPVRGPGGRQQLATRLLDQAQATVLAGTEGGADPFLSPDGQWIGFFVDNQLQKISVQGGAPVKLGATSVVVPEGASWGEDGNIVAAVGPLSPLSRIPGAGGPSETLTKLGPGEITHRWPQVLPGGAAVLFTGSASGVGQDNASIEALSLKTSQVKTLVRGGYYGRYLPSGHLVYLHQGVLFGVGFDLERLEVHGAPTPLLEDVAANAATGGGQFDFSTTGTFVYMAGKSAAQTWQFAWLDSAGKTSLFGPPGTYGAPRLSPDGRKLAYPGDGPDVYIYDLDRDTTTRLTFSGHSMLPVWAPDGKHLVFRTAGDKFGIYWVRSDGAGEPQPLLESTNIIVPWSMSPDGRRLAYFERNSATGYDLWTLPLDLTDPQHPKPGQPEPFLRTPADELAPRLSPDGRWIAYRSNESGSNEIYVRPFPAGSGGKWQISSGGGLFVFWSKNGRELFYETADNRIMVVDYRVEGDSFVPGRPRLWSDKQLFFNGAPNLDLAPDGQRFLVLAMPEAPAGEKGSVHVTMLLNFFDELKRRIPPGR